MTKQAIIDLIMKESIYYFDKNRIYRPTTQELQEKTYYCPRCQQPLIKSKQRLRIYFCPHCNFVLECDNLLDSQERLDEHCKNVKIIIK